MTRRHYQLFALAILIGAPLLVSLLNHVLIAVSPHVLPQTQAPVQADPLAAAVDPAANLPQPLAPPPLNQATQGGMVAGSAATSVPLLDPSGVAVSGSDPQAADPYLGGATPSLDPTPSISPGDDRSSGQDPEAAARS